MLSVIFHTLYQPHPEYFVHLSRDGAVSSITKVANLEAIFCVCSHVTSVGRPGLAVDAEVARSQQFVTYIIFHPVAPT